MININIRFIKLKMQTQEDEYLNDILNSLNNLISNINRINCEEIRQSQLLNSSLETKINSIKQNINNLKNESQFPLRITCMVFIDSQKLVLGNYFGALYFYELDQSTECFKNKESILNVSNEPLYHIITLSENIFVVMDKSGNIYKIFRQNQQKRQIKIQKNSKINLIIKVKENQLIMSRIGISTNKSCLERCTFNEEGQLTSGGSSREENFIINALLSIDTQNILIVSYVSGQKKKLCILDSNNFEIKRTLIEGVCASCKGGLAYLAKSNQIAVCSNDDNTYEQKLILIELSSRQRKEIFTRVYYPLDSQSSVLSVSNNYLLFIYKDNIYIYDTLDLTMKTTIEVEQIKYHGGNEIFLNLISNEKFFILCQGKEENDQLTLEEHQLLCYNFNINT